MTMTPRDRVLAAMKQESLDRPPVAIFTQAATLGQMEKVGAAWPEAHKSAELMAKLGTAQADIFGFECVRAPFCLTAEAERLGATVQVDKKDASPMIKSHPFHFDPMMSEYETHAIVAGNTGPFTLTGNLVNTENMVFGMMMAPEEVDKWVNAVNPIVTAYTHALMDAGADVVQCSEPSGSTDMLAPDMFEDAAGKHVKESLKPKDGKFTVLHICGDTYPILEQMVATGVTGISIEEKVEPEKAADKVGGKTVLVGNVGSVRPLFQGTPEEVEAGAKRSAAAGFNVISSGCGIAVATPDANMEALVRAIKSLA